MERRRDRGEGASAVARRLTQVVCAFSGWSVAIATVRLITEELILQIDKGFDSS